MENVISEASERREKMISLDPISIFFSSLSGSSIAYVPNPGNAGDSLIAVGTYQALRRHSIEFQCYNVDDEFNESTVLVGGGGNLVPLYGESRRAIETALSKQKQLIILPHTIRGNEDLLERLDSDHIVFCRDPLSYDHVMRHTCAKVFLSHDMAFHTDIEQFDNLAKTFHEMPRVFEKRLSSTPLSVVLRNSISSFMRTDGEATSSLRPTENADISKIFEFGVWPGNAEKSAWGIFESVRRSKIAKTDRLHVSIAASLMGHECLLYDNSYGKNSGIFHHSIKHISQNIKLCESSN